MAYDRAGRVILFGGETRDSAGKRVVLDDTWAWDGTDWTELRPASHPAALSGASIAATRAGSLVLYGGRRYLPGSQPDVRHGHVAVGRRDLARAVAGAQTGARVVRADGVTSG
jgi:hypothetical protein